MRSGVVWKRQAWGLHYICTIRSEASSEKHVFDFIKDHLSVNTVESCRCIAFFWKKWHTIAVDRLGMRGRWSGPATDAALLSHRCIYWVSDMGEVRGCFWVPWEGLGWWGTPLWASIHQKHHDGSHLASRRHPTCAVSPREKTWFPGVSPGRAGVYAFCTFTEQNGHSRIHQRFLPSRAGVYDACI